MLKERNPQVQIVAVEPKNASALLGHAPAAHQIQGIGDGFIPAVLDTAFIDRVMEVSDDDALSPPHGSWRESMACWSASPPAPISGPPDSSPPTIPGNIATVFPDRAERYFSTALMGEHAA